jgi:hypothetical protein
MQTEEFNPVWSDQLTACLICDCLDPRIRDGCTVAVRDPQVYDHRVKYLRPALPFRSWIISYGFVLRLDILSQCGNSFLRVA